MYSPLLASMRAFIRVAVLSCRAEISPDLVGVKLSLTARGQRMPHVSWESTKQQASCYVQSIVMIRPVQSVLRDRTPADA
jgi:hypothetical protein